MVELTDFDFNEIAKLPCDVMLPPNTVIRKGCELSVLVIALQARAKMPADSDRFNDPAMPKPEDWREP